jgi:hypothetical protein
MHGYEAVITIEEPHNGSDNARRSSNGRSIGDEWGFVIGLLCTAAGLYTSALLAVGFTCVTAGRGPTESISMCQGSFYVRYTAPAPFSFAV